MQIHPTFKNDKKKELLTSLVAFRHDMHQHPELRYEEHRAADKVVAFASKILGIGPLKKCDGADRLVFKSKNTVEKEFPKKETAPSASSVQYLECYSNGNERGFVHKGLGTTGVVVSVYGKGASKDNLGKSTVGIRADIDALPVTETTGVSYASKHTGKMHACGHDGHTTMALGAIALLAADRSFEGTVHFIFQPAEEGGAGAKAMMEDGLFTLFPCDAVFALHNWPTLRHGQMAVRPGPIMAATTRFEVRIKGRGGHAALPHTTIDPIPVACSVVSQLQTLVSRSTDPLDSSVLTVGVINSGTVENIIPSEAVIKGTVRSLLKSTEIMIMQGIERISSHVAKAHLCTSEFITRPGYPCTTNTPFEAAFMAKVMGAVVGDENTQPNISAAMTAEDFGFMLEAVPGAYGWIGNGKTSNAINNATSSSCSGGDKNSSAAASEPSDCAIGLHHPCYDFNDDNIAVGSTFWDMLARKWLSEGRREQLASMKQQKQQKASHL